MLGKVKQLEPRAPRARRARRTSSWSMRPAAGHAVTFLASAYGLLDAAAVGPIRAQAVDVIGLLGDPARCQVMLVTLPEETPVNEAAETAFHLEDRAGVQLAPIVVNGAVAAPGPARRRGRAPSRPPGSALAAADGRQAGPGGRRSAASARRCRPMQVARLADAVAAAPAAAAVTCSRPSSGPRRRRAGRRLGEQLAAVAP